MASLTIKNIPDNLYEQLKYAANAHHRSINSELIVCLEKVLLPTKATAKDLKMSAQALRSTLKQQNFTADDIHFAKQEGRA
jgi:plasmid stability protein